MNLKTKIFGQFDFSSLDDPEFKEDSVREEIISPLLKSIGWASSGSCKLIRSRTLTHPYVMFGSKKRNLSIIPDYLLVIDEKPCFVLDAKGPTKEITKGDNVAQVYSYAIHPEVRAWNYGLCNGHKLALFEVTSIEPKIVYELSDLKDSDILDINQKLSPISCGNNKVLDYFLDGGMYLHFVMNFPLDMKIHFPNVPISSIGMISSDQFTINAACQKMADRELMFTFDFDKQQLEMLLMQLPEIISTEIKHSLSTFPFSYENDSNSPFVHISCKQNITPAFSKKGEMFFPLKVIEFSTKGINIDA